MMTTLTITCSNPKTPFSMFVKNVQICVASTVKVKKDKFVKTVNE